MGEIKDSKSVDCCSLYHMACQFRIAYFTNTFFDERFMVQNSELMTSLLCPYNVKSTVRVPAAYEDRAFFVT